MPDKDNRSCGRRALHYSFITRPSQRSLWVFFFLFATSQRGHLLAGYGLVDSPKAGSATGRPSVTSQWTEWKAPSDTIFRSHSVWPYSSSATLLTRRILGCTVKRTPVRLCSEPAQSGFYLCGTHLSPGLRCVSHSWAPSPGTCVSARKLTDCLLLRHCAWRVSAACMSNGYPSGLHHLGATSTLPAGHPVLHDVSFAWGEKWLDRLHSSTFGENRRD